MDRDNTTRTGAKDPWGREAGPLAQRPVEARTNLDSVPDKCSVADVGEGQRKLQRYAGMLGASLTATRCRQARSDRLALKPYRGKPAVRNFRGDDGNVGIMRSPVRAIVLLDRRLHGLATHRLRCSRRATAGRGEGAAAQECSSPPNGSPAILIDAFAAERFRRRNRQRTIVGVDPGMEDLLPLLVARRLRVRTCCA